MCRGAVAAAQPAAAWYVVVLVVVMMAVALALRVPLAPWFLTPACLLAFAPLQQKHCRECGIEYVN